MICNSRSATSEGYRTFPDGTRMTLFLDTSPFTGVGPAQFVVDDFATVGLRVTYRSLSRTLFYAEKDAMNFDLAVWSSESDYMPLLSPGAVSSRLRPDSFYAVALGSLVHPRRNVYGNVPPNTPGTYPPPDEQSDDECDAPVRAVASHTPVCVDDQKKLFRQIEEIAAENVWCIGISTAPPAALAVMSKDLRNVPEHVLQGTLYSTPANAGMETWFFDHPQNRTGSTIAEIRQTLTSKSTLPGGLAHGAGSRTIKTTAGWAVLAVSANPRHPLSLRRPAPAPDDPDACGHLHRRLHDYPPPARRFSHSAHPAASIVGG